LHHAKKREYDNTIDPFKNVSPPFLDARALKKPLAVLD
jgi:hypothetical protein